MILREVKTEKETLRMRKWRVSGRIRKARRCPEDQWRGVSGDEGSAVLSATESLVGQQLKSFGEEVSVATFMRAIL